MEDINRLSTISEEDPLAGIIIGPGFVGSEPWSATDPEVKECFEKLRPDVWPVMPPANQLNSQTRVALDAFNFNRLDEVRATPEYETTRATSDSLVYAAIRKWEKGVVERMVDTDIKAGIRLPEDKEKAVEECLRLYGGFGSSSVVIGQMLNDGLPEGDLLYDSLQPASSILAKLAVLEALGICNEDTLKGTVAFGGKDEYFNGVEESDKFFSLTEEGQKKQLADLLEEAEDMVKEARAYRKKKAEAAANEKLFGGDTEEVVKRIKAYVESLRRDGYSLEASFVEFSGGREAIELVRGNIEDLRQTFHDLAYPSGLSIFDSIAERHGADVEAAVVTCAQVTRTGEVLKLDSKLATVYIKSGSSKDKL